MLGGDKGVSYMFGIFEDAIGYGLLQALYILVNAAEVFVEHRE